MSRFLSRAEWLSPKQALELLQKHDKDLTMEGMASYCTELKLFPAYVRLRMAEGEDLDDRTSVYGHGEFEILNPEDALHGPEETTLYLFGSVFDAPDPQASKRHDVEWQHSVRRSNLRILYKRSELERLNSLDQPDEATAPSLQPEPSVNHLLIISKLVQMLKDNSRPRYTQGSIIEAIESEYAGLLGLGPTTLRSLLGTANRARKKAREEVEKQGLGGGSKIRLDKKEIQLD